MKNTFIITVGNCYLERWSDSEAAYITKDLAEAAMFQELKNAEEVAKDFGGKAHRLALVEQPEPEAPNEYPEHAAADAGLTEDDVIYDDMEGI